MAEVDDGNNDKPHSKGAVAVDGVFLEVPVHFIGV